MKYLVSTIFYNDQNPTWEKKIADVALFCFFFIIAISIAIIVIKIKKRRFKRIAKIIEHKKQNELSVISNEKPMQKKAKCTTCGATYFYDELEKCPYCGK